VRISRSGGPVSDRADPAEEEVVKADALIRFILSGNRSLEEFAVLLARISLGVFFAISGRSPSSPHPCSPWGQNHAAAEFHH
jgi:hypothetical protein